MSMGPRSFVVALVLAVGVAWVAPNSQTKLSAADNTGVITGVVSSDNGPEAGVWVIAETDDLQTIFRKIVVTDDAGRYLLPELPRATYDVWVRGYGLVDSHPVRATPDQDLTLTATVARTPQDAAQVYPSNYWLSLITLPHASEFPGTGPEGNGINPEMKTQDEWINNLKGCQRCHQVGSKRTRELPDLGDFDSTVAAWDDRVKRGQRGALMNSFMTRWGRGRGLEMMADWTDRIAGGEVPEAPPRPSGVERNVVITMWNWGDNVAFVHDEIATDKRNSGAPTNDMYGGHRPGNNLFANSLVCVDVETGERVWHFQMVHHDLWDYDNNVAPILINITVDGREIKAVVQLTKQAMAYVLDRETGEPVWPITERPVPGSNMPGEWISPTQPFPTRPEPFDHHGITEDDLIDFTPELRAEAVEILKPYILGPIFTPPSIRSADPDDTKGTFQLPGSVGGAEWGGAGFDPETGMLYVPSVTAGFVADLTPGNPDRMNVRYTRGNREFLAGPRGLPLTKPPYGRITAIDMNTGEHVWMVANGDGLRNHPDLAHLNLPPLGQPGRSMTLLTRTLLFVSEGDPIMVRTPPGAGTEAGKKFRAFDKESGVVRWEIELAAGTNGSPITYMHDGKQYIVLPIGSLDHPGEWFALALP